MLKYDLATANSTEGLQQHITHLTTTPSRIINKLDLTSYIYAKDGRVVSANICWSLTENAKAFQTTHINNTAPPNLMSRRKPQGPIRASRDDALTNQQLRFVLLRVT